MILKRHNTYAVIHDDETDPSRSCLGCGLSGDEEYEIADINDCPVLHALAIPYASHKDYRKEWQPS